MACMSRERSSDLTTQNAEEKHGFIETRTKRPRGGRKRKNPIQGKIRSKNGETSTHVYGGTSIAL